MTRWRTLPPAAGSRFPGGLVVIHRLGYPGNFGHESGAMIAGVLASVAACLVSGREDWRRQGLFAFFGGLGWGLGPPFYMYPISFGGSEQWQTCIYGFFTTFFEGLLWAGLAAWALHWLRSWDANG